MKARSLVGQSSPTDTEEADALVAVLLPLKKYARLLGATEPWLKTSASRVEGEGGPLGPTLRIYGEYWFSEADLPIWYELAEAKGFARSAPDPGRFWGYVYFIQAENGLIKVGYSTNPGKRLTYFRRVSPVSLELLGYFLGTQTDEYYLHQRFAMQRDHGEWFRPSPELLQALSDGQEKDKLAQLTKEEAA